MFVDVVDYLELDKKTDQELYSSMKEHKLRELKNIKTVINNNLYKFDLISIEQYKEYLLQQLDDEIRDMELYNRFTFNTYAEQEYREFLIDYKNNVNKLFDEFLIVEWNNTHLENHEKKVTKGASHL